MQTLVINLSTVDADAVLEGHQTAILRRNMPSRCEAGMRIIFHHAGRTLGEAVITSAARGSRADIARRYATAAWLTEADAAEYLHGARHPGAILVARPQRYTPSRPWSGQQPLGHMYI